MENQLHKENQIFYTSQQRWLFPKDDFTQEYSIYCSSCDDKA